MVWFFYGVPAATWILAVSQLFSLITWAVLFFFKDSMLNQDLKLVQIDGHYF